MTSYRAAMSSDGLTWWERNRQGLITVGLIVGCFAAAWVLAALNL